MNGLLQTVQNLFADLLIGLFTAVNRRVDLTALILRWFTRPDGEEG